MFQCVPEIENFAAANEPFRSVPDPFRSVANDYHCCVGTHPAQLSQLCIKPVEYRIGIPQTTDQKPPYPRIAPRRGFDTFIRQQQNAGLDLTEMAVGNAG